jgi:hypothetical protein
MVNWYQINKLRMAKIIYLAFVNLVTPKAGAKHELLLNKPASGNLGACGCEGRWSAQGRTGAHRVVKHLRGMERAWAWGLQRHGTWRSVERKGAWSMKELKV